MTGDPDEVEQLRRDLNFKTQWDDDQDEITELRITALEELLAARWPRSVLLRRRLARDLRASVRDYGPDAGEDFTSRRTQAIGDGWIRLWRQR